MAALVINHHTTWHQTTSAVAMMVISDWLWKEGFWWKLSWRDSPPSALGRSWSAELQWLPRCTFPTDLVISRGRQWGWVKGPANILSFKLYCYFRGAIHNVFLNLVSSPVHFVEIPCRIQPIIRYYSHFHCYGSVSYSALLWAF